MSAASGTTGQAPVEWFFIFLGRECRRQVGPLDKHMWNGFVVEDACPESPGVPETEQRDLVTLDLQIELG